MIYFLCALLVLCLYIIALYKEFITDLQNKITRMELEHKVKLKEAWKYYNDNLINLMNKIKKLEDRK